MTDSKEAMLSSKKATDSTEIEKTTSPTVRLDSDEDKKMASLQKCDQISELLEGLRIAYGETLSALTDSDEKSVDKLKEQLSALKRSIHDLEKKRIKRIKLIGTLTRIQKMDQKIKLKKPGRKKDLTGSMIFYRPLIVT